MTIFIINSVKVSDLKLPYAVPVKYTFLYVFLLARPEVGLV